MRHFRPIITALQRLGRSCCGPLAVATLVLAGQATAHAGQTTFAQFTQAGAGTPFMFTNNGGTSGTVGIQSASTQVDFNFTTATGLSTATHEATLTLTAVTNEAATSGTVFGTTYYNQAINGGSGGASADVLTITDNTTHQNLLTMSFTGTIVGQMGNSLASLTGNSDPAGGSNVVMYSSDYLNLSGLQPSSYQIGLQALSVPFSLGAGSFLNSFMSSFTGSFQTSLVPEPASIAMFGTGIFATIVLAWQRKRRPLPLSPQTV